MKYTEDLIQIGAYCLAAIIFSLLLRRLRHAGNLSVFYLLLFLFCLHLLLFEQIQVKETCLHVFPPLGKEFPFPDFALALKE